MKFVINNTVKKMVMPCLIVLLALFLIDASYGANITFIRSTMIILVSVIVLSMAYTFGVVRGKGNNVSLSLPLHSAEPEKKSFRERVREKIEKKSQNDLKGGRRMSRREKKAMLKESIDHRRKAMVGKLKKEHDIKFYTTQHLTVQKNLGFGKGR